MQETPVWFLIWEYTLEKEMATHCSILAWWSRRQRSLAGYSPWGRREQDTTERLTTCSTERCWLALLSVKNSLIKIYMLLFKIHYCCTLNRLQSSEHNFCMHKGSKNFVWLALLWYWFCCGGLELKLHHLQSLSVFVKMVKIPAVYESNSIRIEQNTWQDLIKCTVSFSQKPSLDNHSAVCTCISVCIRVLLWNT